MGRPPGVAATCILVLWCLAGCGGCRGGVAPRPNVLLITIDTLRADFVHSYGFGPATTPNIDALAERGARFEMAIAASSATAPALASIMTSRYTREHSLFVFNGPSRLEGVATLASHFESGGYATAAFVSNVVLKRRSGLDLGFQVYDDELPSGERNRPGTFEREAEATSQLAIAWLREQAEAANPLFLWVHYQDPHGPYSPPEDFAALPVSDLPLRTDVVLPLLDSNRGRGGIPVYQQLGELRRPSDYGKLYAGEIAYSDHWIGRLVEAFEARSAASARGAAILLTADHGESFGESGFFFQHGHATTPELARVPLILVAPDLTPGVRAELVSHVDIAPTLLDLAGLPALSDASGVSLLPVLRGEALLPERTVHCDVEDEVSGYRGEAYLRLRGRGKRAGPGAGVVWQAMRRSGDGSWRVVEPDPDLQAELRSYLDTQVEVVSAEPLATADVERLRALGYLPPADPGSR